MNGTSQVSLDRAIGDRVGRATAAIEHALRLIQDGRPDEIDPDTSRRRAVIEARAGFMPSEARRLVSLAGPEAIWGQTVDFVDVAFFELGRRAAAAVCRIATSAGQGIGTGFLISPQLLITNNHVIGSSPEAQGMVAEFDYERDTNGAPMPVTRFALEPRTAFVTVDRDDLDYTVVALGNRLSGTKDSKQFGYLPLSTAANKHVLGDFVNIIQHPAARMKEVVLRENQLVHRDGNVLLYVADTEPGSSGSPVLNVKCEVVALHHWGGPHLGTIRDPGLRVPKTVNEGVRASAIATDLSVRAQKLEAAQRELVVAALALSAQTASPPTEERDTPPIASNGSAASLNKDGTATWTIPVSFSIRVGSQPTETGLVMVSGSPKPQAFVEREEARVVVDRSYGNRGGYDPEFLGTEVPLPSLSARIRKSAAKVSGGGTELKYEHFSIVMNGDRRLAFFTATNIDGRTSKDVNRDTLAITDPESVDGSEGSDHWFVDPRIDASKQTPEDMYDHQTTFDASGNPITNRRSNDHRNRMFQKGHLTRRQDPTWGSDRAVLRANADTFHVTNCTPQVGFFNMGVPKGREEARAKPKNGHPGGNLHWRALEEYVLANARADKDQVTVFTGPVLDDETDIPWSRGRADLKGFKAPRRFWKVLIRVEDKRLHSTAFLIDQKPLIDYLPEALDVSEEEAARMVFDAVKRYHVSVPYLEDQTGLDFGAEVRGADTFHGNGEGKKEVTLVSEIDLEVPRPRKNAKKSRSPKSKE